ncbi:MAG: hypothetical protein IBJ11_06695 [Phycisphaerales bacterium]|nr:hypothetical protein [Phycisphaerales bacterium]
MGSAHSAGMYIMSPLDLYRDRQVNQYTRSPVHDLRYDPNGSLPPIPAGCFADADGNGKVGADDLSMVLAAYGTSPGQPGWEPRADVDLNGSVGANDLTMVLTNWGKACHHSVIVYDFRNQMVAFTAYPEDNHANPESHSYHYDALGRRVRKITDEGSNWETWTVYVNGGDSGWQILEEREGAVVTVQNNTRTVTSLGAGGDTRASWVYSGGYIDDVVSMRRDPDGPAGPEGVGDFYYHADDQYSVQAITDSARAVRERYDYHEYGTPRFMGANWMMTQWLFVMDEIEGGEFVQAGPPPRPSSRIGNPFLFTGREYDPETKLFHYRTRYLHTALGRFTTRDTIGVWGDPWNLGNGSQYVAAMPTSSVDPSGNQAQPTSEREDPARGCGVRVKRNLEPQDGLNFGHEWIEFDELTDGRLWRRGLGFWPRGWYRGRDPESSHTPNEAPSNGKVPIFYNNDPYTGKPKAKDRVVWPTRVKRRAVFSINSEDKLRYGRGQGTACSKATCEDIRDCLRNFVPDEPWEGIDNNCRQAARDAIEACCLVRGPSERFP